MYLVILSFSRNYLIRREEKKISKMASAVSTSHPTGKLGFDFLFLLPCNKFNKIYHIQPSSQFKNYSHFKRAPIQEDLTSYYIFSSSRDHSTGLQVVVGLDGGIHRFHLTQSSTNQVTKPVYHTHRRAVAKLSSSCYHLKILRRNTHQTPPLIVLEI